MIALRFVSIPLIAVTSLASPGVVRAQEPAAAPIENRVPPAARAETRNLSEQNVRVDVSVTVKGADKPVVKSLSLVASDGRDSQGRAGVSMPIANNPGGSFSYKDIGINVDAVARVLPSGKVALRMKLQFSTVYRVDTPGGDRPSFGNGSHEVDNVVFESGKPLVVFHGADAETGRDYTVQVTATILK
jgi:hypothetical protein